MDQLVRNAILRPLVFESSVCFGAASAVFDDAVTSEKTLDELMGEIDSAKTTKEMRTVVQDYALNTVCGKNFTLFAKDGEHMEMAISRKMATEASTPVRGDTEYARKVAKQIIVSLARIREILLGGESTKAEQSYKKGEEWKYYINVKKEIISPEIGTFTAIVSLRVMPKHERSLHAVSVEADRHFKKKMEVLKGKFVYSPGRFFALKGDL